MFGRREIEIVITGEGRSIGSLMTPVLLKTTPGPDLRYGGWHDLPKKPRKRWKSNRHKGR